MVKKFGVNVNNSYVVGKLSVATAILYVRCILLLRIIISNNSVIRYLLYVFLVYVAGNSLILLFLPPSSPQ